MIFPSFFNIILFVPFILLFVASVEGQKQPKLCPNGWDVLPVGRKCVKIVEGPISQPKAMDACHRMGGKLASIHDEKDEEFLLGLLGKLVGDKGFWLGLQIHRTTQDKELISCSWTDGTKFDYGDCKVHSGMAPWAKDTGNGAEPNNFQGNEACVFIRNEVKGWIDHSCTDDKVGQINLGYVCMMN